MASIRVGMMAGLDTLRFVYTFEESLPRREGGGSMARQFSGAATFEFRRDGEAWQVTGHFFDDIGRSGQISLRQGLAGIGNPPVAQALPTAAPSEQPQPPRTAAEVTVNVKPRPGGDGRPGPG
jgi:hypothetical protein